MGDWLADLPLWWGKVIAVLFFLAIAVWTWRRPKSYILKGAPDNHGWRDLRVWATVLMVIQIFIYLAL